MRRIFWGVRRMFLCCEKDSAGCRRVFWAPLGAQSWPSCLCWGLCAGVCASPAQPSPGPAQPLLGALTPCRSSGRGIAWQFPEQFTPTIAAPLLLPVLSSPHTQPLCSTRIFGHPKSHPIAPLPQDTFHTPAPVPFHPACL